MTYCFTLRLCCIILFIKTLLFLVQTSPFYSLILYFIINKSSILIESKTLLNYLTDIIDISLWKYSILLLFSFWMNFKYIKNNRSSKFLLYLWIFLTFLLLKIVSHNFFFFGWRQLSKIDTSRMILIFVRKNMLCRVKIRAFNSWEKVRWWGIIANI